MFEFRYKCLSKHISVSFLFFPIVTVFYIFLCWGGLFILVAKKIP